MSAPNPFKGKKHGAGWEHAGEELRSLLKEAMRTSARLCVEADANRAVADLVDHVLDENTNAHDAVTKQSARVQDLSQHLRRLFAETP